MDAHSAQVSTKLYTLPCTFNLLTDFSASQYLYFHNCNMSNHHCTSNLCILQNIIVVKPAVLLNTTPHTQNTPCNVEPPTQLRCNTKPKRPPPQSAHCTDTQHRHPLLTQPAVQATSIHAPSYRANVMYYLYTNRSQPQ